ncbi:MAG: hypothetical protein DRG55_00910 [Deltaproteobacteria bacterium]|nr:MAG: hypothetical protein DRG55_00910 [Deltaproteobacteria bacterium]
MDLKLIVLGLLIQGPAHGYELRQRLQRDLYPFLAASAAPLYYALRKLEEEGLVTHWSETKGRRPQRYVYRITEKGKRHLQQALLKGLKRLQRPPFDLDVTLYFLDLLDRGEVVEALKERLKELRKLRFLLKRQRENLPEHHEGAEEIILEHNRRMVETEIQFVKDLIGTFSDDRRGSSHRAG